MNERNNIGIPGFPDTGSISLAAGDSAWESTDAADFEIKRLLEDDPSGAHTWLMRVAPGAQASPHAHEQTEQIFVVEGTFYDDEGEYVAGNYIVRAPGAIHTGGSRDGAVVLLVYF